MVNKNNLVLVSFTGPNGEACNADNQPQPAAYFTLLTAPPAPPAPPTPTPPPIVFPTIPDVQGGNPPILSPITKVV